MRNNFWPVFQDVESGGDGPQDATKTLSPPPSIFALPFRGSLEPHPLDEFLCTLLPELVPDRADLQQASFRQTMVPHSKQMDGSFGTFSQFGQTRL